MASSAPVTAGPDVGTALKYVLFSLEGETYGVPILQTREIISEYQLTVLPNLPDSFHGVISLRGEAIPVINLRERFELPARARDGSTRIIIVEAHPRCLGIQVDAVLRVASFASEDLSTPPDLTEADHRRFISRVAQDARGKFVIIVDMIRILESVERIRMDEVRAVLAREELGPPEEAAVTGSPTRSPVEELGKIEASLRRSGAGGAGADD